MKVFMFEYPAAKWEALVKRRKWRVTDPESGTTWFDTPEMVIDAAVEGETATVNIIAETKKPIPNVMWDFAVLPDEPRRIFAGHDETPFDSADDMPADTKTRIGVVAKLEARAARKAERIAERRAARRAERLAQGLPEEEDAG